MNTRYNASIILKNGGSGWRVGDNFNITQSGKTFNVRVSSEAFDFTFASDGTATFTTPSNATRRQTETSGAFHSKSVATH